MCAAPIFPVEFILKMNLQDLFYLEINFHLLLEWSCLVQMFQVFVGLHFINHCSQSFSIV